MDLLTPESLPPALRNGITYQELVTGQALFQQGDPALAVFIVETGRLRLFRYTTEGKMVTFYVARAGEIFAEVAIFSDFYTDSAVAEVDSRVAVYPKQLLLDALCEYPNLAEDFMTLLVRKIQSLKFRLELRDIRSAHERVLQYLRHLAQPDDDRSVNLDRPLKDIAGDLGLTPETLSRTLRRLEREGAIARVQRVIMLQNSSVA